LEKKFGGMKPGGSAEGDKEPQKLDGKEAAEASFDHILGQIQDSSLAEKLIGT